MGVAEASFSWALNSPLSAYSPLPTQPTVRKTKQTRPKIPIRFIIVFSSLNVYMSWHPFIAQ